MSRATKTGRSKGDLPKFTPLFDYVMDSPAFESLTPLAECVLSLLLRRAGFKGVRNGHVFLSVREVAERWKVSKDTASAAFHLLQARGFTRPTQIGRLGIEGEGRATTWLLTVWPAANGHPATRDFLSWSPGNDFPVQKGRPPSHSARNPVPPRRTPCPSLSDDGGSKQHRTSLACPSLSDDGAGLAPSPVLATGTPKELPGAGTKRRRGAA